MTSLIRRSFVSISFLHKICTKYIPGCKGSGRNKKEMTLINTKENDRHDNDMSKSSRNQRGSPLCTVIGSNSGRNLAPNNRGPCPCCNRQLHSDGPKQKIVAETITEHHRRYNSLFEVHSEDSDDSNTEDLDELDRMLPGVLAKGIAYTVKNVIAQGCVDKKGSGYDWIGSRAWKARWAVLVVR